MEIGVSTRLTYNEPVRTVQKIVGMERGIEDIEIFCRKSVPHQSLSSLKELGKAHGINYYLHAPFLIEEDSLSSSEVSSWYWTKVEDSIKFADELDSSLVTFHPGPLLPKGGGARNDQPRSEPTIVGRQYFNVDLKPLEDLLQKAKSMGITLCLENLGKGVGADLAHLRMVLTDYESLGFTFDVGHANISHNMDQMMEDLRDQIAHIHLHDNCGDQDNHLALGTGTIDYPYLLKRLDNLDLIGIMELSSMEELEESVGYLESLKDFQPWIKDQ